MAGCDFLRPTADSWSAMTGIPSSVYIAIANSESNFCAAPTYFGISGRSPSGHSAFYDSWESVGGQRVNTRSEFATYTDPNEAFGHFHSLISTGRYAGCWGSYTTSRDVSGLLHCINGAGYATDPSWADKIMSAAGQQPSGGSSGGGPPDDGRGALGLPGIGDIACTVVCSSVIGLPDVYQKCLDTCGNVPAPNPCDKIDCGTNPITSHLSKVQELMQRGALLVLGVALAVVGVIFIAGPSQVMTTVKTAAKAGAT